MSGNEPTPGATLSVNLMQSTAYAVRGRRTILVDAGPAGQEERLLRRLSGAGISPSDVSLIVLTHCHPDHAGGAAELSRRLDVPVAVHANEVEWATTGTSIFHDVIRPFGYVLRRMLSPTFPAVKPDLVLEEGVDLEEYGVPLRVLHTPGHTTGSVTLLDRLSGDALVGDLLAGSMIRRDRPDWPFFAEDTAQIRRSVQTVLASGPSRLLFGHGMPASARSVRRRFGSHSAS
ncbi:MBL fold metallo-hydrolase [Salinactinospora qingdaonensis]|uniref:MBL fold metallo-hydrolase n=1 Tax=Salinactinospora qingdaonensis TaxID=702744 RepID=A0ABP7FDM1_9ACTN